MRRNTLIAIATATCLMGVINGGSLAAGAFEGVWKVADTGGQPFEITLSGGGVAKATRGEGMNKFLKLPAPTTSRPQRRF